MLIWKKRLNDYELSDPIIIFLIFIAMLAVAAEMVSIGIFLPLFEFINQYGVEGIKKSESDMVKYVYDFFELTGFNLTIEILLISSFILFLLSKILLYMINYIQSYYTGLMSKNMKDQLLDNYLIFSFS